jgi:hypothetical protein
MKVGRETFYLLKKRNAHGSIETSCFFTMLAEMAAAFDTHVSCLCPVHFFFAGIDEESSGFFMETMV